MAQKLINTSIEPAVDIFLSSYVSNYLLNNYVYTHNPRLLPTLVREASCTKSSSHNGLRIRSIILWTPKYDIYISLTTIRSLRTFLKWWQKEYENQKTGRSAIKWCLWIWHGLCNHEPPRVVQKKIKPIKITVQRGISDLQIPFWTIFRR